MNYFTLLPFELVEFILSFTGEYRNIAAQVCTFFRSVTSPKVEISKEWCGENYYRAISGIPLKREIPARVLGTSEALYLWGKSIGFTFEKEKFGMYNTPKGLIKSVARSILENNNYQLLERCIKDAVDKSLGCISNYHLCSKGIYSLLKIIIRKEDATALNLFISILSEGHRGEYLKKLSRRTSVKGGNFNKQRLLIISMNSYEILRHVAVSSEEIRNAVSEIIDRKKDLEFLHLIVSRNYEEVDEALRIGLHSHDSGNFLNECFRLALEIGNVDTALVIASKLRPSGSLNMLLEDMEYGRSKIRESHLMEKIFKEFSSYSFGRIPLLCWCIRSNNTHFIKLLSKVDFGDDDDLFASSGHPFLSFSKKIKQKTIETFKIIHTSFPILGEQISNFFRMGYFRESRITSVKNLDLAIYFFELLHENGWYNLRNDLANELVAIAMVNHNIKFMHYIATFGKDTMPVKILDDDIVRSTVRFINQHYDSFTNEERQMLGDIIFRMPRVDMFW